MKRTYIEIQKWGDFDVPYTDCIMVSPEEFDPVELTTEFFELKGINSFSGHDLVRMNQLPDEFIEFLRSKEFYKLRTHVIRFSD